MTTAGMERAEAGYDPAVEGARRGLIEEEPLALDDYVMAAEEPRRSQAAAGA